MKGERCKSSLLVLFLSMLMLPDLIHSRSYPIYTTKRFGIAGPPHLPPLLPFMFSASHLPTDFELPDYDDNYTPYGQMDEIENYPLAPLYGYYYGDQTGGDTFLDFEEDGNVERAHPYGGRAWFEEDGKDDNMDFMRNLALSEMDQGPGEGDADPDIVYGTPVQYAPDYEDGERDRTYYYGVPVYEERERSRNRKGDSLRELEFLTRQMKAEEDRGRTNEELVPYLEDEVFWNQLQKRMSRSGRKNSLPLRKGFKISQKRFYAPEKSSSKTDARQSYHVKGREANRKNRMQVTTPAPQPKKSPTGQKEYVLARPASPVRKPVQKGVYARGTEKADVYGAIKKLIAMEGGVRKENRPRIQKRFVLSEDQLTSQLSGLKRISV